MNTELAPIEQTAPPTEEPVNTHTQVITLNSRNHVVMGVFNEDSFPGVALAPMDDPSNPPTASGPLPDGSIVFIFSDPMSAVGLAAAISAVLQQKSEAVQKKLAAEGARATTAVPETPALTETLALPAPAANDLEAA